MRALRLCGYHPDHPISMLTRNDLCAASKETERQPPICTAVAEAATTAPSAVCPWALLQLARWCRERLDSSGGSAPCPEGTSVPRPPASEAPTADAGVAPDPIVERPA